MGQLDSKAVVARYLDRVWNEGDVDGTASFFTAGYRRHTSPSGPALDIAGQAARLKGFRSAFPDVHLVVDEMIAEGDLVAFRFTMTGTHEGPFQGIAPTGVRIAVFGVDMVRLEGGKLVEHWGGADVWGIVQQLKAPRQP